ncbi:hypothetical protein M8J76_005173 [Diaphorina citri]|nr:hypothetical protein M8J76_005173 [Diaphorina citri]
MCLHTLHLSEENLSNQGPTSHDTSRRIELNFNFSIVYINPDPQTPPFQAGLPLCLSTSEANETLIRGPFSFGLHSSQPPTLSGSQHDNGPLIFTGATCKVQKFPC